MKMLKKVETKNIQKYLIKHRKLSMILTIGSWFNEPGISFKISYKILNLVRKSLVDNVMKPYKLEDLHGDFLLNLVVATGAENEQLDVRGPEIDKRGRSINYGLWLPYKEINTSRNYVKEYLNQLFDSLVIVFENYGIPAMLIRDIQTEIELQVIDNEFYSFA